MSQNSNVDSALLTLRRIGEELSALSGSPAELYVMERGTGLHAPAGEGKIFYVKDLGARGWADAKIPLELLAREHPQGEAFEAAGSRMAELGLGRAVPRGEWAILAMPTAERFSAACRPKPAAPKI